MASTNDGRRGDGSKNQSKTPDPPKPVQFRLHWANIVLLGAVGLFVVGLVAYGAIVRDSEVVGPLASRLSIWSIVTVGIAYAAFRVRRRSNLAGNLTLALLLLAYVAFTSSVSLLTVRMNSETAALRRSAQNFTEMERLLKEAAARGDGAEVERLRQEVFLSFESTAESASGQLRTILEAFNEFGLRVDEARRANEEASARWFASGSFKVTPDLAAEQLSERVELTRLLLGRARALHELSDLRLLRTELVRRGVPESSADSALKAIPGLTEFETLRQSYARDIEFIAAAEQYLVILNEYYGAWQLSRENGNIEFDGDTDAEIRERFNAATLELNEILRSAREAGQ